MSIGPDAASAPQPVGAAPEVVKAPEAGAAPQPGQEKTVPLAALIGEQDNTRHAREQASLLRAHMELAGWTFGEDGSPAPPARQPDPSIPAQAPQIPPKVQALAASLGVDPMEFLGAMAEAFGPMASSFAAPMVEGNAQMYKTVVAQRDPDYKIYEKDIDAQLAFIPVNWRGSAKAMDLAIESAKAKHLPELIRAGVERERNPGKVVGRFTEGAAPGTTQVPVTLSPEAESWAAQQGFSPEVMAKAAELKAQREGGRR